MNVKYVARALADAMLFGQPETHAVCERCAKTLGRNPRWLRSLVKAMIAQYGDHWPAVSSHVLAESILAYPPLIRVVRKGDILKVHSYFVLPATMGPRPAAVAQCALPDLPTSIDLAHWLDIHPDELQWLARFRLPVHSDHYAYRWVPKRSDGWRLIEMPKASLRALQRKLLHGLLEYVPPHEAAHGFRSGHSILTNAQAHIGQRVVLKMDLQDFFLTLRGTRVDALFRTLGYPNEVARTLTALCTNRVPPGVLRPRDPSKYSCELPDLDWITRTRYGSWHLPQGAPTSPALANLCAFRLDLRLQAAADQFEASYTRYADDLSFSGDPELLRRIDRFIPLVGAIAMEEGLRVNFRKTRVMTSAGRQEVTGVVVNQKANVRRYDYDNLKAMLYNCARRGPSVENRAEVSDFRAHLTGRVAHATMLNPSRGRKLHALLEQIDWASDGHLQCQNH